MVEYTDTDGTPLLFVDDIEQLTGWKNATLRHYSTAGKRARESGKVPKNYGRLIEKHAAAMSSLDEAIAADADSGPAVKRVAACEAQLRLMPPSVKKVRRTLTKANGDPLVVWSPLWREDHVHAWLRARGVAVDA